MNDHLDEAERPRSGEVHAWVAALDRADDEVDRSAPLLSSEESRRSDRFRHRRHRDRYVIGRATLRRLLAAYLGGDPATLDLRPGPFGKPELAGVQSGGPLYFNLSHSNGVAAYVFTGEGEIGVDVEERRAIPEPEDLAERYFSPQETLALRAQPARSRADAFLRGWTRKEAFLKARGDGLQFPLDRFSVSLAPGEPARLLGIDGDPRASNRWTIAELPMGDGYYAAVAVHGRISRIVSRPAPDPWPS